LIIKDIGKISIIEKLILFRYIAHHYSKASLGWHDSLAAARDLMIVSKLMIKIGIVHLSKAPGRTSIVQTPSGRARKLNMIDQTDSHNK